MHIILAEARLAGELDGLTLAHKVREAYPDIEVYVLARVPNIAEKATQLCEKGCLTCLSDVKPAPQECSREGK